MSKSSLIFSAAALLAAFPSLAMDLNTSVGGVSTNASVGDETTASASVSVSSGPTAGVGVSVGNNQTSGVSVSSGPEPTAGVSVSGGSSPTAGVGVSVGTNTTTSVGVSTGSVPTAGVGVSIGSGQGVNVGVNAGITASVDATVNRNGKRTGAERDIATHRAMLMGQPVVTSDGIVLGNITALRERPGSSCPLLEIQPNPNLQLSHTRIWMASHSACASSGGPVRVGMTRSYVISHYR